MTHPLLAPLAAPAFTAKNRLAVAPMTRVTATADGCATDRMTRYYDRFAKGGFGMVITEGLYTDKAHSKGYIHQPGMSDDAQAASWKPMTDALRAAGTLSIAQIMHAGAISQGNTYRDSNVGPSVVQPRGKQMAFYYGKDLYALPQAISEEQIADAITGFADTAARSLEAGFDGIEIHGANGYLLDQFLTDYTNQRSDRFGGDTRARLQLSLEVIRAVRARVGAVPVGIRISQGKVNDFTHKWAGGEADAEVIFGTLADTGVDFLHVTEFEAWQPAFAKGGKSLVELARAYAPKMPLIANGSLHDLDRAQEVMDQGADILAMGRGALANPDMPKRIAAELGQRDFDSAILGPIADVKDSELALA